MAGEKLISVKEIQRHSTAEDCWVVVDGNVWDITEFAPEHPGGGQSMYITSDDDDDDEPYTDSIVSHMEACRPRCNDHLR